MSQNLINASYLLKVIGLSPDMDLFFRTALGKENNDISSIQLSII